MESAIQKVLTPCQYKELQKLVEEWLPLSNKKITIRDYGYNKSIMTRGFGGCADPLIWTFIKQGSCSFIFKRCSTQEIKHQAYFEDLIETLCSHDVDSIIFYPDCVITATGPFISYGPYQPDLKI